MMVGLEQQVAVARLPKLLVGGINYHTRSKLVLLGTCPRCQLKTACGSTTASRAYIMSIGNVAQDIDGFPMGEPL